MGTTKTAEQIETLIDDLDPDLTVPVSVRLPVKVAYLLYLYAEQMNTSAGKLVTSILEDALPTFKDDGSFNVKVRVSQVYRAMVDAKLALSVNPQELRERVLSRADPGQMRRPRKPREKRGTEGK